MNTQNLLLKDPQLSWISQNCDISTLEMVGTTFYVSGQHLRVGSSWGDDGRLHACPDRIGKSPSGNFPADFLVILGC
ncbi:MAG TPA: hypothetical protein DCE33_06570 [Rhodospirillaceae bacterium]|nr:hypothetical protein [Rhodospirillaceae bacterium]